MSVKQSPDPNAARLSGTQPEDTIGNRAFSETVPESPQEGDAGRQSSPLQQWLASSALPYTDAEKQEIEALTHLENERLIHEYNTAAQTDDAERIKKIKWKIVLANIPLIYAIAWPIFKKYRCAAKGFEIDDLVSVGYEGILRAIVTFDASRNLGFATYAGWWVRSFIVRYIHDHDRTVRLPQYIHEKIPKIRMAEDFFLMQGRADCSDRDIAEQLGWDEREVTEIRAIVRRSFTSIDSCHTENPDSDMHHQIHDTAPTPESVVMTESWHAIIRDLLAISPKVKGSLTIAERSILKLRFGIMGDEEKVLVKIRDETCGKIFKEIPVSYDGHEKTLDEIGEIFGVTRERIRQIELAAMRKLRRLYYTQFIKEADPSVMTIEELSLIQLLRKQKSEDSPSRKRSRKHQPIRIHESENLKILKQFMTDKDIIIG
ncbi:MAG: sigma-70 family RNA polymerase sigma factor [Desulfobacterota bacterium]|nr:sigma-70 family RNA polymerase sigma factor [Thermodesulfobacteriota bacterium]